MAVFAVAIYALHRFSREVNWSDVKTDLAAQSWDSIFLAIAATGLSYLAMAFYDVLGTATAAPGKVPPRIAFLAGSAGYAVTNLLGFSWLTGGAVRYRLYSSYGLDLVDIAQVIANVWLSFWLGLMSIIAALFLFHPSGLSSAFGMTPRIRARCRRPDRDRDCGVLRLARPQGTPDPRSFLPAAVSDRFRRRVADGCRHHRRARRRPLSLRAASGRPDRKFRALFRGVRLRDGARRRQPFSGRRRCLRGDDHRRPRRHRPARHAGRPRPVPDDLLRAALRGCRCRSCGRVGLCYGSKAPRLAADAARRADAGHAGDRCRRGASRRRAAPRFRQPARRDEPPARPARSRTAAVHRGVAPAGEHRRAVS